MRFCVVSSWCPGGGRADRGREVRQAALVEVPDVDEEWDSVMLGPVRPPRAATAAVEQTIHVLREALGTSDSNVLIA